MGLIASEWRRTQWHFGYIREVDTALYILAYLTFETPIEICVPTASDWLICNTQTEMENPSWWPPNKN